MARAGVLLACAHTIPGRGSAPLRRPPLRRTLLRMVLAADYPFLEILGTMIVFFAWIIWIWVLVVILSDVFRRSDLSGWGKAGWTLFLIVLPFLGALIYLGVHGRDINERRIQDMERSRYGTAGSGPAAGPAEQIAEAKRLLDGGAIDEAEFAELKRRALA